MLLMTICDAQLSSTFYDNTCPNALSTIRTVIRSAVSKERRMAASLIRLHFHDCFVQGCDGSILLDDSSSIESEKSALQNANSIRGYSIIDQAKTQVEKLCPEVVSCADIVAVAARDASFAVGGPSWTVKLGRRDSTTASKNPQRVNEYFRLEITREAVGIRQREKEREETMATLQQFTFTDFKPSSSLPNKSSSARNRTFLIKASSSSSPLEHSTTTRRHLIAQSATAISLSFSLPPPLAKSEDSLSEWERVFLPIDPGVVLLDIAFVPDDPNHGFLLGTRQTILETKDGGNTWAPRSIPSAEEEDFNYRFNSISFKGKEGWIVGKPAILLYTADAGDTWERIPLSAQLPGDMVYIKATGEKGAEMVTDEGAIYVTSNRGYNWKAAVQETVSATLNRTVSSGISGASYYTGTFNTVNRSPDGRYVAVSSRGNFYLTWEPGQPFWQPHNRAVARRIQNMGWRADGGLWLLVRGGGLYLSKGTGLTEEFEEVPVQSRGFGILDVGYRSTDEAWAAGGSGILLRTTNGGKSWIRDKAADNIAANLYSVKFIDDKKGFVLGNDGVLLRYLG
ncbi:hypothetical protein RJT34_31722 [Clitoria ternatea]|uniref:peroxidase n=1 Tax=Clitoria ternatea TaxID=43366 RepID=A0AAN9EWD3_CLITE